jgi:hypothetical protein
MISVYLCLCLQRFVFYRQQLAPKAEAVARDAEKLAVALVAMCSVIATNGDNSASGFGTSAADVLESIWGQYMSNGAGSRGAFGTDFSDSDGDSISSSLSTSTSKKSLTAADLALSKKEAQRKLSAEDFKLWKKAQKGNKKKTRDDYDDEDD